MIWNLILAAVTPLFVPATPSPSPAALPEIGRVRSSAMCSTLKENIRPAIGGLIKNDELIGAGHRAFLKMSSDQAGTSSAAIDIDMLYLEQVETRLVHNLKVIDTMLGDKTRFPAVPRTNDEQDAIALRSQLLAVADAQRKALDLVSGTLDTEALGQMQHERSDQMDAATGQAGPPSQPTSEPVSFIGSAGLPDNSPTADIAAEAQKKSTLVSHNTFNSLAQALEGTQLTIARRETVVSSAVIAAVGGCHAQQQPQQQPAPPTTPTP
jgi:hypothetical protein